MVTILLLDNACKIPMFFDRWSLRARRLALAKMQAARSSLVLEIGALSHAAAVRSVSPSVSGVQAEGSPANSFFVSILILLEFTKSLVGEKSCRRDDNPGDDPLF
jgi:hypothetical protein